MQLRFRTVRTSRVRFFASLSRMKPEGFLFLDPKVKWPESLPRFELKEGEESKRWHELERALEWLASERAERSQGVVAVGGGALLDTAALAASLYRRGMKLTLVPTTLLAMVDATLGGKTAVDRESPDGLHKNFAGTFYPADEVWICLDFLKTLPIRERVSGAGEAWKTLWLAGKTEDRALLDFVREGKISPRLAALVKQCLAVKKRFVEQDPLDTKRIRESLNYGHTVGHALESLAGGRLSHGEAVLWGMAAESRLLGTSGKKMAQVAEEKIRALSLSVPEEFSLPAGRWLPFLKADKKNKKGMLEMTVLAAPGKLRRRKITPTALAEAIRAFPASFRP